VPGRFHGADFDPLDLQLWETTLVLNDGGFVLQAAPPACPDPASSTATPPSDQVVQEIATWPFEASRQATFPLSINDQRPDWERHSKDCQIDFVALEDCPDPPWNLLSDAIQQTVHCWNDPPCRATLELHSFRVIIKSQPGERGGDWDWKFPAPSGAHGGAGAAIFYAGFVAAVIAVASACYLSRDLIDEVRAHRHTRRGPPYTLGGEYQSGVTCEVKGSLVLTWSDGRTHQSEVAGVANSGPYDPNSTTYLGDDIGAMIQNAIRQLGHNWREEWPVQPANP
jgi:hypothetical protein